MAYFVRRNNSDGKIEALSITPRPDEEIDEELPDNDAELVAYIELIKNPLPPPLPRNEPRPRTRK